MDIFIDNFIKVPEALGLTFKTPRELNDIIDTKIPGRPQFHLKQIKYEGVPIDLYYRPIMDCIASPIGDPTFAEHLIFPPERHYVDQDMTIRLYHDMHTGKWWWDTQVCFFCFTVKDAL